jgi:hypothetical protein
MCGVSLSTFDGHARPALAARGAELRLGSRILFLESEIEEWLREKVLASQASQRTGRADRQAGAFDESQDAQSGRWSIEPRTGERARDPLAETITNRLVQRVRVSSQRK